MGKEGELSALMMKKRDIKNTGTCATAARAKLHNLFDILSDKDCCYVVVVSFSCLA